MASRRRQGITRSIPAGRGSRSRPVLSEQLTETLRALLTERKAEKLRKGRAELPAWVFTTEEGTPLDGDNLRRRVFYRTLNLAKLRHIRIHDLRHSYASRVLQDGQSLMYVKEQMGHFSIQVTVDIYGHPVPGANRHAVDRLDDRPASASEKTA